MHIVKVKKILIIEGAISFGGSTIGLLNIAKYLDRNLFDVSIVCLYNGSHVKKISECGYKVILLKNKLNFTSILLIRVKHFFQFMWLMNKLKIDLVHLNNGIYYPAIFAAKLSGKPCIVHLRSLANKLTVFTKIPSLFVDSCIAISKAVRISYSNQNFRFKNINIIPDGIDFEQVEKNRSGEAIKENLSLNSNNFIVGSVSRLEEGKGLDILLDSLALVIEKNRNTKLIIVGDGPLRFSLEKQSERLGIKNNTIFTGYMNNPYSVVSFLDIFVLPSLKEGLSLAVMEAMALGVPVVASKVGGIVELIEDGTDGLLIKPGSPTIMAKAILKLIEDKKLMDELGYNAAKKALQEFPANLMASKIEEIYQRLICKI